MMIAFTLGETISNDDLTDTFKCAPQGGMRRSLASNTLVLVSNHVNKTYDDRQNGDIFLYTGMGMSGDQSLAFAQNKTLSESRSSDIELHFFEVFIKGEYIYRGVVELVASPYESRQVGEDGKSRLVWIFPLKLLQNNQGEINENVIVEFESKQRKTARKLTPDELHTRAQKAGAEVSSRNTKTTTYIRNQYIAEYTRRNANGICQLCGNAAPFNDMNSEPYLESHHIVWLSLGGPDSIENTTALCPNCHRRMHVLDDKMDVNKLVASKHSS